MERDAPVSRAAVAEGRYWPDVLLWGWTVREPEVVGVRACGRDTVDGDLYVSERATGTDRGAGIREALLEVGRGAGMRDALLEAGRGARPTEEDFGGCEVRAGAVLAL